MRVAAVARWTTLGALFAVPFLPLFVVRSLYFPFVVGRAFAFRGLIETALAGWLLLALTDRRYRPQFSILALGFGLFVAWMAIADACAVNPHRAFWGNFERMEGWVTLAHLAIFFIVAASVLGAEGLWRRWWSTFVAASGIVCGYGLLQMAHLAPISRGLSRIDAASGNPEFLAGYLLFAIAASLWLALDRGSRPRRLWRNSLFALAGLQTVILMASGTRGAFIGLVAALATGLGVWLIETGKRGRGALVVALAGLTGLAGGVLWLGHTSIIARNPVLARFAHISLGDLSVRFAIWRMAWDGFLSRPITGWGQEGFVYVFYRFYEPSLAGQEPWFDRVHNLYLDWLVAGGLPAFLLLLAILGTAAWGIHRGPFSRAGRIVLLGGLVAYAVQALVVFDSLLTYIPLVAILAMVHSFRSKPIPALERVPEAATRSIETGAAPLAILSLAIIVWFVNIPTLLSGRYLASVLNPSGGGPVRLVYFKRALDQHGFASQEIRQKLAQVAISVATSPDVPAPAKASFGQYAITQVNQELARAPHEAQLRLELAMLYRSLGRLDEAARETAVALAEAPNHPLLLRERALEDQQGYAATLTTPAAPEPSTPVGAWNSPLD